MCSDNYKVSPPDLQEYRRWLVAAEQKSQEDFDKTVLSLSGGALGISFVFLKDVVGERALVHPFCLLAAWVCWGISVISVLLSFHLSHLALRAAIQQVDDGTIYSQPPGGKYARMTAALNALGGAFFFAGVLLMTIFVAHNTG